MADGFRFQGATSEPCPGCGGDVFLVGDVTSAELEVSCSCGALLVLC